MVIPGVLTKFFSIAKTECANYSAKGPNGKQDFCWLGSCTCLLKDDKPCRYFGEAVIGYKPFRDKGLLAEWQDLCQGVGVVKNKVCACGEEFRMVSPRQRYCPKCQRLSQTEKARLRKRRQREKIIGGSGVTLLA